MILLIKNVIIDSTLPYRARVLEKRTVNHKFYIPVLDSRYVLINGCELLVVNLEKTIY